LKDKNQIPETFDKAGNKEQRKITDLRSSFSTNLPELFRQLNISLAVSTYQAGKLIFIRPEDAKMNTHFRNFQRPMGIAVHQNQIAIGCKHSVEVFKNVPAIISRLPEPGNVDACFIPISSQQTGGIDIHEMAYGNNNVLWAVNTKFSCLVTFDANHSFVPRWRPHFISGLEPADRCHLNGLALENGVPKFVTALGQTNTPGGWRANKRDGGLLMDVPSNKIIFSGLSMPHSPRWYNNELYLLESGHGTLVKVDLASGEKKEVCRFPGFTRGLDFVGPLAFVGLSKVRETATFSDFPLLEQLNERVCGVYICNIETGKIIGLVKFEGDVEEIFAVQVLRNTIFPEQLPLNDPLLENTWVIPDDAIKDVEVSPKLDDI